VRVDIRNARSGIHFAAPCDADATMNAQVRRCFQPNREYNIWNTPALWSPHSDVGPGSLYRKSCNGKDSIHRPRKRIPDPAVLCATVPLLRSRKPDNAELCPTQFQAMVRICFRPLRIIAVRRFASELRLLVGAYERNAPSFQADFGLNRRRRASRFALQFPAPNFPKLCPYPACYDCATLDMKECLQSINESVPFVPYLLFFRFDSVTLDLRISINFNVIGNLR
jgi:hypothetical protein